MRYYHLITEEFSFECRDVKKDHFIQTNALLETRYYSAYDEFPKQLNEVLSKIASECFAVEVKSFDIVPVVVSLD